MVCRFLTIMLLLLACQTPGFADSILAVWNSSVPGAWDSQSNWSLYPSAPPGFTYPQNDASHTYTVIVPDGTGAVTYAVPGLTSIDAAAISGEMFVQSGSMLQLVYSSSGAWADPALHVLGGGTLDLGGGWVTGTGSDWALNEGLIHGTGVFGGFSIMNNGRIESDISNNTLFSGGPLFNAGSGVISAINGGSLFLSTVNGPITNLGHISALDGTIVMTADNVIDNQSSIYLASELELNLVSGGANSLVNEGTIWQHGTNASLVLTGDPQRALTAQLTGAGFLVLAGSNSAVQGTFSTETLYQGSLHTIIGSGQIADLSIENHGIIRADPTDGPELVLSPGSSNTIQNGSDGTLEAMDGGVLRLKVSSPVRNDGLIQAVGAGVIFVASGAGPTYYMLNNYGTVNIESGIATFAGVAGGVHCISNHANLIVDQGDLLFTGAGTFLLDGGGQMTLTNGMIQGDSTVTLENVSNTIQGSGQIAGLHLLNSGTIDANSQTLEIKPVELQNSGTLQASDGGELFLVGGSGVALVNSGTMRTSGSYGIFMLDLAPGTTFDNQGQVLVDPGEFVVTGLLGQPMPFRNDGIISIGAGGTLILNDIRLDLEGSGQISLQGSDIMGNFGIEALHNNGNTIHGYGGINNLEFDNLSPSSVVADTAGQELVINATFVGNGGTFQAVNGGSLVLDLTTATFENSGLVSIGDTSSLVLRTLSGSASIVNSQNISLNSSGGAAQLILDGATNGGSFDFSGGGSINLAGARSEIVAANLATLVYLSNDDNTIQGGGTIRGLVLQNSGTIDANSKDGPLVVQAAPHAVGDSVNFGEMYASSAAGGRGRLVIDASADGTLVNEGLIATRGGDIDLIGAAQAGPGHAVLYNSNEGEIDINAGDTMTVRDSGMNGVKTVFLDNDGNIVLDSGSLVVSGANTILSLGYSGSGHLNMLGSAAIRGETGTEHLYNWGAHAIRGEGVIDNIQVYNTGTIEADRPGGELVIRGSGPAIWNDSGGTMKASGGGTLTFDLSRGAGLLNTTVGGYRGQIAAEEGSTIQILSPAADAVIVNDGDIRITGTESPATLLLASEYGSFRTGTPRTFEFATQGGGVLQLSGAFAEIKGQFAEAILLNDAGHTITGQGTIYNLTLNNYGTIIAGSAGELRIAPGENQGANLSGGVMQAAMGGTLTVDVTSGGFSNHGLISAAGNGSEFGEFKIVGSPDNGFWNAPDGRVVIDGGRMTLGPPPASLTLTNDGAITISNNGSLVLEGGSSWTVSGSGTLSLNGSLYGTSGQEQLSNSGSHTIDAAGSIYGLALENRRGATIRNSTGDLVIAPHGYFYNDGTLVAENGHTILIDTIDGYFLNIGRMEETDSAFAIAGDLRNFGVVSLNDGAIGVQGPLANFGSIAASGAVVEVQGDVSNRNGAGIALDSGGFLSVWGSVTADQNSSMVLDHASQLAVNGDFENSGSLSISGGSSGVLGGRLDNTSTGSVFDSGNLTMGEFDNAGDVRILAGGSLTLEGSGYYQTGGSTLVNGTLQADTIDIEAGILSGVGDIYGDVYLGGWFTREVAPAVTGGNLEIFGNLEFGPAALASIALDSLSSFDQISITGDMICDGDLDLTLRYAPNSSSTFELMRYGDWYGAFDQVSLLGLPNGMTWKLEYLPHSLVLTLAGGHQTNLPDPATYYLAGGGLILLSLLILRRRNIRAG